MANLGDRIGGVCPLPNMATYSSADDIKGNDWGVGCLLFWEVSWNMVVILYCGYR